MGGHNNFICAVIMEHAYAWFASLFLACEKLLCLSYHNITLNDRYGYASYTSFWSLNFMKS